MEGIATRTLGARTVLGAPGLTSRNKKLLGAPGTATGCKGCYERGSGDGLGPDAGRVTQWPSGMASLGLSVRSKASH